MSIARFAKPLAVLLLPSVFFSTAGSGQTRKHDLSFQAGFLSGDQLKDIFEDRLLITISLGTYDKDDMRFSAIPVLTYHYSVNSKFGFGAAFGYYSVSGALVAGDAAVGDFREKNYIGAVELDYHWVMRPGFELYSGAGFGVKVRSGAYTDGAETDKETKALPAFHLNAIGLRVGKKVGVFAELGVGYKGILALGVNGRF
jgi:hypothetical protein